MAESPKDDANANIPRYVVLLNKAPRGPLSEAEIRVLLSQGVVRHNDIALQIDEKPSGLSPGWKFLWQYPAFDRRRDEENENSAESLKQKAVREERRKTEPPPPTVSPLLPSELAAITPEELLLKSEPMKSAASLENYSAREISGSVPFTPVRRFNFKAVIVPVTGLATFIAVVIWLWPSGKTTEREVSSRPSTNVREESNGDLPSGSSSGPLSSGVRPMAPRKPANRKESLPTPTPVAPMDRGISNEQGNIPQDMGERRDPIEDEAPEGDVSDDDAFSRPRRKGKVKPARRGPTTTNSEDNAEENPADSIPEEGEYDPN